MSGHCFYGLVDSGRTHSYTTSRILTGNRLPTANSEEMRAVLGQAETQWKIAADPPRKKQPTLGTPMDASRVDVLARTSFNRELLAQGRASVPGDQTSVRPCEDPLPRPGQEPRPTLHAVRAQQPVPGAKEADRMRTSLSEIRQTASTAGLKARNQPQKARLAAAEAFRQPCRRS